MNSPLIFVQPFRASPAHFATAILAAFYYGLAQLVLPPAFNTPVPSVVDPPAPPPPTPPPSRTTAGGPPTGTSVAQDDPGLWLVTSLICVFVILSISVSAAIWNRSSKRLEETNHSILPTPDLAANSLEEDGEEDAQPDTLDSAHVPDPLPLLASVQQHDNDDGGIADLSLRLALGFLFAAYLLKKQEPVSGQSDPTAYDAHPLTEDANPLHVLDAGDAATPASQEPTVADNPTVADTYPEQISATATLPPRRRHPILVEILRGIVYLVAASPVIPFVMTIGYLLAIERQPAAVSPVLLLPALPPLKNRKRSVAIGVASILNAMFFVFLLSAPIVDPRLVLNAAVPPPPTIPFESSPPALDASEPETAPPPVPAIQLPSSALDASKLEPAPPLVLAIHLPSSVSRPPASVSPLLLLPAPPPLKTAPIVDPRLVLNAAVPPPPALPCESLPPALDASEPETAPPPVPAIQLPSSWSALDASKPETAPPPVPAIHLPSSASAPDVLQSEPAPPPAPAIRLPSSSSAPDVLQSETAPPPVPAIQLPSAPDASQSEPAPPPAPAVSPSRHEARVKLHDILGSATKHRLQRRDEEEAKDAIEHDERVGRPSAPKFNAGQEGRLLALAKDPEQMRREKITEVQRRIVQLRIELVTS